MKVEARSQATSVANSPVEGRLAVDRGLRERAGQVLPAGVYGHMSTRFQPPGYPQFFSRGRGARVWDADGNEYVDLMCSWGPVILGHLNPEVEQAAAAQRAAGDVLDGPGEVLVALAERFVDIVDYADWVMFAKNGTDATTLACTVARAASGRADVLVAEGAYHGSAPWCTPFPLGTTSADRANVREYRYNDLDSVRAAAEQSDGVAAILTSPFRHDAGYDQEMVDPAFARGLRQLCDDLGCALVLDDVRAGFRLNFGSSWSPLGVSPDLSAWSKAIANGYPLAALTGTARYREAAGKIFATGSFWMGAVDMAAAIATLAQLESAGAVARMTEMGQRLKDGILAAAGRSGYEVVYTGPVQMPYLRFADDPDRRLTQAFASEAVQRGVFLHASHNWFVSAALEDRDLDFALSGIEAAFQAVRSTNNPK